MKKNCESQRLGFRGEDAAVSRRPPVSFVTIVDRSEGYTHAATYRALSLDQGPSSVAPCQTLWYDSHFFSSRCRRT